MIDMTVTGWYDGEQKPVRPGTYERKILEGSAYWFWNGNFWEYGGCALSEIPRRSVYASNEQNLPWRGLAKNPKEVA